MRYMDLSGQWNAEIQGEPEALPAFLPGTLDENGIGPRDTGENQWLPIRETAAIWRGRSAS